MILENKQHHQLNRSVSFLLRVLKTKLFYAQSQITSAIQCKKCSQCNIRVLS